jgi:hypothetical protein
MHLLGGREITKDFNEIHFHEDDDQARAKLEMWIAKQIGDMLVTHYPNRQWGVEVDTVGQMVIIMCPSLSLTKGYHLAMKNDTIQALVERCKHAAGEILERYGISRSRVFNPDVLETLDRNALGEAESPDAEGVESIIKHHG